MTTTVDPFTTLRLEGRIAGPWIGELAEACERLLGEGRGLTLDLADVSMIERPGLALLVSLAHRGVHLVRCSPFQEAQLKQAALAQPEAPHANP